MENKGVLRTLKRVFTQACKSSSDKFPVCAVAIKVKPKDLDVNLDPNKHTVLMKQQAELNDKLETTLTHFYKLDEDDVPDNMSDTSLMEGSLLDKSAGVTYDLYSETEGSAAKSVPSHGDGGKEQDSPDFEPVLETDVRKEAPETIRPSLSSITLESFNSIHGCQNQTKSSVLNVTRDSDALEDGPRMTQKTLEAWTKGKIMNNRDSTAFEPVKMFRGSDMRKRKNEDRSPENTKFLRAPESAKIDSFLAKIPDSRAKKKTEAGNRTLEQFARSDMTSTPKVVGKEKRKIVRKVKTVSFSLGKTAKDFAANTRTTNGGIPDDAIIGRLQSSGYWIVRARDEIQVVNHHRLREVQLYERLLRDYKLTAKAPDSGPIDLARHNSWNEGSERILESLTVSDR